MKDTKKAKIYLDVSLKLRQVMGNGPDRELLDIIHLLEKRAHDQIPVKKVSKKGSPEAAELRRMLERILRTKPTVTHYIEELERSSVMVKAVISEGSMKGFRYEYKGQGYSSGQLGEEFAWQRLPVLGLDYDHSRDMPALIQRAVPPQRETTSIGDARPGLASPVAGESTGD